MSIKIMMLGISIILLGIAISTMNFFGFAGGVIGIFIAILGFLSKMIHDLEFYSPSQGWAADNGTKDTKGVATF